MQFIVLLGEFWKKNASLLTTANRQYQVVKKEFDTPAKDYEMHS